MFNKKEIVLILIVTFIIGFATSSWGNLKSLQITLISSFLVVGLNVIAKKITSYYLELDIEMRLWEIERYGLKPKQKFKKPFPTGAILPIISKVLLFPIKNFAWMASLVFNTKPKTYRAAKRHGLYSFSEITESHLGLIAASGIIINLICAVIGYFIGFEEFARINIFFAFFNMLPLSDLDGNKIFFGNLILWSFLASLVLIGLFYTFIII
jgi:Zn-dependent protease